MNVWEALAQRKFSDEMSESPEGRAFAHLFGSAEGFGKAMVEDSEVAEGPTGALISLMISESLAALLNEALDYYEKELLEDE